jgi:hypothetical protein
MFGFAGFTDAASNVTEGSPIWAWSGQKQVTEISAAQLMFMLPLSLSWLLAAKRELRTEVAVK